MQKAILTLSKNTNLIEQIRSNLEEGGRYYVQGVTSAHGSLAMVRHRVFDVAIIDLDQSELTATQLVYNLKKIQPEIKILIYSPEGSAIVSEINELPIDGILKKPFFAPELSDLLKTLLKSLPPESLTNDGESLQQSISRDIAPVPEDSLEEMSHLLAKTSAASCMIFQKGDLVSQSAGFPPAEAQRVIDYISEQWKTFKNCEICRFMRVDGELGAQLTYALPLGGDALLVFTYPASVDLPTIRRETSKVRDAYMIGRYARTKSEDANHTLAVSQILPEEGIEKEDGGITDLSDLETPATPPTEDHAQWILEFNDVEISQEPAPSNPFQASLADTQPIPVRFAQSTAQPAMTIEQVSEPVAESAAADEAATQAEELPEAATPDELLSTYHCLIVPADGKILLTPKLGETTSALIREIHLNQGWLLAHLTVRPLYAFWTVRLPVENSPAKVIDAVKGATSQQLAADFPEIVGGNVPFWAPGYWILSGGQPPSGRVIEQFLRFRSQKNSDSQETR